MCGKLQDIQYYLHMSNKDEKPLMKNENASGVSRVVESTRSKIIGG